ncbi:ABC transporter ATP-binding protein [Acaricomes phytoseiuli]|uniref:metal ABC transporter ATP-binding protein n=1 Tax=Acaricomes phytoseiuli TaxID=291968 RepID=UPI0003768647|nr:ABC transporter ATP-binding protein [Acaricomes phytoseiuli]MCW1249372.1 ABC transporter ATP-binding protein [Acaricomes phytoseiuli]
MDDVLRLHEASLSFGERVLWHDLNLAVRAGEFFAVLGPNGSGKTSFLKVLLGLQPLSSGTVQITGRPPCQSRDEVGYVPQQKGFPAQTPLRSRDLVGLGLDGNRWGFSLPGTKRARNGRVDQLLADVGASHYADAPVGLLSGGEQQRLRIAQALATDPKLLLCDEPLLSLDLNHQRAVSTLVARQAHEAGAAVVFVTHEINPIIDYVDRVLYLAGGRFQMGTPDEVMTSEVLSDLYQTPIDVLRSNGRILVSGHPDATTHHHHSPHDDLTSGSWGR